MIYLYLRVSICVVSTRKAIRFSMNYGAELKQVVHTHWTSCRSGWPSGFGELNPSPRSYHSLPLRSERCQHSTFEFGAAQLRFVTELAPKSPFLCVNKIPIWYDFRASANLDIRYSVSMVSILLYWVITDSTNWRLCSMVYSFIDHRFDVKKFKILMGNFLDIYFVVKKISDKKSRHFDLKTSKRRYFLSLIFITKCSKLLFQSEASAKSLIWK